MAKVRHTSKNIKFPIRLILIWSGLSLVLGWPILLGVTNLLQNLPCTISPTDCAEGASFANLVLYSPIIAGAIMLPVGFLYDYKMSRESKFGITLTAAGALVFIAFWLIVFVGIAIHGLQG